MSESTASAATASNCLGLTGCNKQDKLVEIIQLVTEATDDLPFTTYDVVDHSTRIPSILHVWEVRIKPTKKRKKAEIDAKTSEDDIKLDEFMSRIAAIEKEIPSLMKLSNEYVVEYEAFKIINSNRDIKIYLLQPHSSIGRLSFYLDNAVNVSEGHLRFIAKGILRSLSYLHQNNVVHRDLKDRNICQLNTAYVCRIADYSIERRLLEAVMNYNNKEPPHVYPISPGKGGQRRDIYRLGVILISLCRGWRMDKVIMNKLYKLQSMKLVYYGICISFLTFLDFFYHSFFV